MTEHIPPTVKVGGDVVAAGIAGGAWMGLLPDIAAGLSIVWLLIQIWDWAGKRWWRK